MGLRVPGVSPGMSPGVSPWGTSQEVTAAAWVSPWHLGGVCGVLVGSPGGPGCVTGDGLGVTRGSWWGPRGVSGCHWDGMEGSKGCYWWATGVSPWGLRGVSGCHWVGLVCYRHSGQMGWPHPCDVTHDLAEGEGRHCKASSYVASLVTAELSSRLLSGWGEMGGWGCWGLPREMGGTGGHWRDILHPVRATSDAFCCRSGSHPGRGVTTCPTSSSTVWLVGQRVPSPAPV